MGEWKLRVLSAFTVKLNQAAGTGYIAKYRPFQEP